MRKLVLVFVLFLAACAPKATPTPTIVAEVTPTHIPPPTPAPTEAPTAIPVPTNAFIASVESAWPAQEKLIVEAKDRVFNDKITDIFLSPMMPAIIDFEIAHMHCRLMKMWGNVVRVPEGMPDLCKPEQGALADNLGITVELAKTNKDTLYTKVFFYEPEEYCIFGDRCPLWSISGEFIPVMGDIGQGWSVVSTCQPVGKTTNVMSRTEWEPYLKDPVAVWLKGEPGYVEIVANRDSWISWGWASGKGWVFAFKVCP